MKKIIILTVSVLFSCFSYSQQSNTLYFMKKNPQSNLLNPSFQDNCKLTVGGLLVNITPVFGQVFTPLYINYNNTSFDYNDIIHKGEGIYQDSLIVDIPNFINNLRKHNYVSLETHLNILSVGYKYEDFYFSLNVAEKFDFKTNFSRDLLQIPWLGNAHPANLGRFTTMDIGVNATHYREIGLGASWKYDNKWTFGARAKMLFGMMNIKTHGTGNKWLTDYVFFGYKLSTDTKVNASLPFVEIYYNDTTGKIDSLETIDDFDPIQYALNTKNKGASIDLGVTYNYSDKINLYASIIDLGFIRWKDHTLSANDNGTFYFRGVDVSTMANKDDTTSVTQNLLDTLEQTFRITGNNDFYTSYLTPKVYLGGTYRLTEKLDVGGLARFEMLPKIVSTSLTLSANYVPIKWFSLSASYSIHNNIFYDFGLGFTLKVGPWRMFLVNDNVSGMIWPQKTRNINWRTGLYLGFGCGKKKDNSSLLD